LMREIRRRCEMTSAMLSRGYWSHNCGGVVVWKEE
jgi:hypothetical protein